MNFHLFHGIFPVTDYSHSGYSQCSSHPGNSRFCCGFNSLDSPKWWILQGSHCFAWKNIFLFHSFWNENYSSWKSPPRASNPNISQHLQAHHCPMSPNVTFILKCQLKLLFAVLGGQISQAFFLQAICHLLNVNISMAKIFPVSFRRWNLSVEKWTQVWG